MNQDRRFRQLAGWMAILSVPLAYGTLVLSFVGIGADTASFDTAVNQNAASILPLLAQHPTLPLWSSLLDFFGFYLLLIPLALYLWYWLHLENHEWMSLFTLCGLGYLLFGALGAAILAVVFPSQAVLYKQANGVEQQIAAAIFAAVGAAVQRGIWGILDPILGGVWWAGTGWLIKGKRPFLGWVTIILGGANLLSGFAEAFQLSIVASIGLGVYFLLAPFWAGWLGLYLLRDKAPYPSLPTSE